MGKKKNGSTAGNLPAIRIGTRVRCTDDGVEGRITWANAASVKIKWDDGEQVTWKRSELANKPIEFLDADQEAEGDVQPEVLAVEQPTTPEVPDAEPDAPCRAVFRKQPTSEQVRQFLGRVITTVGAVPKYLVTDCGAQFACAGFSRWCRRRGIRQRRGAVGQHGSIALAERFIRTLKDCCLRVLSFVPLRLPTFPREVALFFAWYNDRPHMTLHGATPDEVYFGLRSACLAPRFEPRAAWPRASPCAKPMTLVKGHPGVQVSLNVTFVAGRRHLPRVSLTRAA